VLSSLIGADFYVSKPGQTGQYRHYGALLHPALSYHPDYPSCKGVFRIQHGDGISFIFRFHHIPYRFPFTKEVNLWVLFVRGKVLFL
jgi:hypothetical protein